MMCFGGGKEKKTVSCLKLEKEKNVYRPYQMFPKLVFYMLLRERRERGNFQFSQGNPRASFLSILRKIPKLPFRSRCHFYRGCRRKYTAAFIGCFIVFYYLKHV